MSGGSAGGFSLEDRQNFHHWCWETTHEIGAFYRVSPTTINSTWSLRQALGYLARVARDDWREAQVRIALAGGKPSKEEPDWKIPKPGPPPEANPLDAMSFDELKAHFAKLKAERGVGVRKSFSEMQAKGSLKGVNIG